MPRPAYVIPLAALCLYPACSRRRHDESDHSTPAARPATAAPAPTPTPAPAAPEQAPTPSAPPPAPAAPVTLQRAITVGRWPEGISAQGDELWVAESGARAISHFAIGAGTALGSVRAGRLPIRVHASADGTVQAVSATDQTVWLRPPGAPTATALARLPDYPEDVVWSDDGTLWALLWTGGSSAAGAVVRIAPGERAVTPVATVGANAFALAVTAGRVWVLLRDVGVVPIDVATGQAAPTVSIPGFHTQMTACAGGVYVSDRDAVVRVDPATASVSGRQTLVGGARAMACGAGGALWVVGDAGQIAKLDPTSLAVQSSFTPTTSFTPTSATVVGGSLLVATHAYNSDDAAGAVLVFNAP